MNKFKIVGQESKSNLTLNLVWWWVWAQLMFEVKLNKEVSLNF